MNKLVKDLTDRQCIILECLPQAFAHAAFTIHDASEKSPDRIMPESEEEYLQYIAYYSAIQNNFGLAFELAFKVLHAKSGNEIPHEHSLVKLFDGLPEHHKTSLENIYKEKPKPKINVHKAYDKNGPKPEAPKLPITNFKIFLGVLDKHIKMYDARYVFEKYDRDKFWYNPDPYDVYNLLGRIKDYSSTIQFPHLPNPIKK